MTWRGARLLALAAAIGLVARSGPSSAAVSGRIVSDNDHYDFWIPPGSRVDAAYTGGTTVELAFTPAPERLAERAGWALGGTSRDARTSLAFAVHQAIYMPWLDPPERPFAGWLELAAGLDRESPRGYRELWLRAGVGGPPSQAERIQAYFHRHFAHIEPLEWTTRIPAEPGVELDVATHGLVLERGRAMHLALATTARARVGVPATDARAGLEAVAGLNPPSPWGRLRPGAHPFMLYLRAAPHVDVVLRDAFLAGALFRPSPSARAKVLVPESELGIGAGWLGVRLEWNVLRRAREARDQPEAHTYGSLVLSYGR